MLAKTIFAATFLALAQFAVATPPGCLLGAVNEYSDPSDVASVCKEKDLTTKVASYCGDDAKSALAALADICNDQGVKVATDVPTSTSVSSKPSGTGSYIVSPTGSGSASGNSTAPTATGGPKASGTSTGGLAESTGAAGRIEIGVAAVVAGLMVIAL